MTSTARRRARPARALLAPAALALGASCVEPRPTAPLPSVAIVTLGHLRDPEALDLVAAEGLSYDSAWSHAPSVRPALASALTGYLPRRHGVRDPIRHEPAVPTLADLLDAEGWAVRAASTESPRPLHPGETWGFEVGTLDAALAEPDPVLLWLHVDDAALPGLLTWQRSAPDRHLVVTTAMREDGPLAAPDAGRVPLIWVGPGFPEGLTDGDPVGQIDLAATVLELTGLPTSEVDGVDLREGGSREIEREDARPTLALGQPGVLVVRGEGPPATRLGLDPAPVHDLAPAASTVRAWRAEGVVPTDPFGVELPGTRAAPVGVGAIAEVGRRVRNGRLRTAATDLDALELLTGSTAATTLLRADLLQRDGRPEDALALLEAWYEQSPSAGLALRIGHAHLDGRDPAGAAPWFERVLAAWPDHPDALTGLGRSAMALGQDALVERSRVRLASVDAEHSARLELAVALMDGLPGDLAEARRLGAHWPDDPWTALLEARALWSHGRAPAALEFAEQALVRHPRDVGLRLELTTWYLELGDADRAVRLVGPVVRWLPADLRVATLFAAAKADLEAERAAWEAKRERWRREREAAGGAP